MGNMPDQSCLLHVGLLGLESDSARIIDYVPVRCSEMLLNNLVDIRVHLFIECAYSIWQDDDRTFDCPSHQ